MAVKTIITEDAKDTAKKVRKALKEKYPESKFKVTTDYAGYTTAVDVEHVGGFEPDRMDMRLLLNRFKSSQYDANHDFHEVVGYEYEGQHYHGADHIHYIGAFDTLHLIDCPRISRFRPLRWFYNGI